VSRSGSTSDHIEYDQLKSDALSAGHSFSIVAQQRQLLNFVLGVTKTHVDKLSSATTISGRTEATHRFLKLTQPIRQRDLPETRVFEAGKTYSFPFTFVVPAQLLPRACGHRVEHEQVMQAHLQLPPSFGDASLSGYGSSLMDDLAPDMSKIIYSIRVTISQDKDGYENVLTSASKKLRVKPAFDEQPPLDIDGMDNDYCHRQEKTIRKGMLSGKLGRLVIEASQPKGFRLPALSPTSELPAVSSMAKIVLRFDPKDESSPPPRLSSVTSKLKVMTFFASSPRAKFPNRNLSLMDMSQGYTSEMLSLSSMCVAAVEWRKHEAWESPISRRDSAMSTATASTTMTINSNTLSAAIIPDPSANYKGKTFYTATILVPVSLPTSKNLVPTFHTCLVSRIYAIHLTLSAGGAIGTALTLKLPVQISSEGSMGVLARQRESEQIEQAARDADATFEPRNVAPPASEYMGQSHLDGQNDPPGYNAFRQGMPRERAIAQVPVCG
jgi:hypothetical protein